MIKFSVLLSVYKNESYIYFRESLDSIYSNQTVKPNEIVIVRDGPLTNELNLVIANFIEMSTVPVYEVDLPTNIGLGSALNEGLKYCNHDWVFRMDTDDISAPTRFEEQVKHLEINPELVLMGTNILELNEDMTIPISKKLSPSTHSNIYQYTKKRNPFNHMTVAFRKEVIMSVGGYQHHLYMEDYNLWIRVIAAGYQVGNLNKILVNVRGGGSMIKRRKGLVYVRSEWQLAKLKIEKNIDSPFCAYLNFIIRSIPRLLPTYMLSIIYKLLRK